MWTLKPDERLLAWKKFRARISELPIDKALKEVTHLWSYAPFVNYSLDPDNTENWPDPWTLIYENYYCDIAKTLGMLYTVYLSAHGKELDIELRVLYDPIEKASYNVVWIDDGKYILNLDYDNVVNKEQIVGLELRHWYSKENLKLKDL